MKKQKMKKWKIIELRYRSTFGRARVLCESVFGMPTLWIVDTFIIMWMMSNIIDLLYRKYVDSLRALKHANMAATLSFLYNLVHCHGVFKKSTQLELGFFLRKVCWIVWAWNRPTIFSPETGKKCKNWISFFRMIFGFKCL